MSGRYKISGGLSLFALDFQPLTRILFPHSQTYQLMSTRILPLLAFAVWCFLCRNWYVCHIKQRCGDGVEMSKIGETSEIALEKPTTPEPAESNPTPAAAPAEKPVPAESPSNSMVEKVDDHMVVHYDYNKLDKESNAEVDNYLDQLATTLKSSGQKVTLVGHTDGVGDGATNVLVSERRAKNVRDILKSKGVSAAQIITKGMGESTPIGSNDNPTGRRQNRRVEVFLSN
jgi:outer membrane protein OmpA-like peptidoglycan-associated protein